MSSVDTFKDLVSEFEAVGDSKIERFLKYAARKVDAKFFGDDYEFAVVYYAGHLMKLSEQHTDGDMPVGAITSASTARVSVSSTGPTGKDDELKVTPYGQAYCELRDSRPHIGPHVAST